MVYPRNKVGKIILLLGSFRVGKSSIIKCDGVQNGKFFETNLGWKIFGTAIGADSLRGRKAENITILQNTPGNIIIAGMIYSHLLDLIRYSYNHDLLVVFLKTSKENNRARCLGRSGNFPEASWAECHNKMVRLHRECVEGKYKLVVLDNNRGLDEVREDFWKCAKAFDKAKQG